MEETGTDFLKIGLILAAFPLWGPFAKALYEELQVALRPEGGLFGDNPSPRERRAIEAEIELEEMPQVHEPLAHLRDQLGHRPGTQGRARHPGQGMPSTSAGPQAGAGRQAFRGSSGPTTTPPRNTFR
ncbi:hypothetical protein CMO84_04835 [Candidatus Woesearchaeota archaeon]|nr:hypothetical protein [Candidatus Woesearchaeota archaeon]